MNVWTDLIIAIVMPFAQMLTGASRVPVRMDLVVMEPIVKVQYFRIPSSSAHLRFRCQYLPTSCLLTSLKQCKQTHFLFRST